MDGNSRGAGTTTDDDGDLYMGRKYISYINAVNMIISTIMTITDRQPQTSIFAGKIIEVIRGREKERNTGKRRVETYFTIEMSHIYKKKIIRKDGITFIRKKYRNSRLY